jgi:hypothetical protein
VRRSFVMNQGCCQTAAPVSTGMSASAVTACENRAVRTSLRRLLGFGILAGAAYAVWRSLSSRTGPGSPGWQPQPFPFPPQPAVNSSAPWVDAADSGACPAHHPVKAKLASGIFHVPGTANYSRTLADRCYISAEAAGADGLRAAKR